MPRPSPGEFDKLASVAIQGGGVYGLTLLGQLQAVLDAGYAVAALSGTSAGAVVAALFWAGLSPAAIREVFAEWADPATGTGNEVLALLGGAVPGRAMTPAAVAKQIARMNRLAGVFAGGRAQRLWRLPGGAVAADGLRRAGWRAGGVFPGDEFERRIDGLVRRGVREQCGAEFPPDAAVTFGQLWELMQAGRAFFPALTLTATNLSARELVLLDSTDRRFAGVPVARAVRASSGFPLFFRPVPITLPDEDAPTGVRTDFFADGGVVCNFPGFVFAGRTRADHLRPHPIYLPFVIRPWVNVGLRLEDALPATPTADAPPDVPAVVGSLAGLLSGGTRTILESLLAENTVERLTVCSCVRSESDPAANLEGTGWGHGLLDFDKLDAAAVRRMFDAGRQAAADTLAERRYEQPPPDEVEPRMGELGRAVAAVFGDPTNERLKVRATLFVTRGLELVLAYRWNVSAADPDHALALEYYQGLVGWAFVRRRPAVCNLRAVAALPRSEDWFGMNARLRASIRPDRTWLFSVPVYDPLTADPFPADNPAETGVPAAAHAELPPPVDAALFGVLSVDACLDYESLGLSPDAGEQLTDPRVGLVRDAAVAAAWDIGKLLAARFGRVVELPSSEGELA